MGDGVQVVVRTALPVKHLQASIMWFTSYVENSEMCRASEPGLGAISWAETEPNRRRHVQDSSCTYYTFRSQRKPPSYGQTPSETYVSVNSSCVTVAKRTKQ